jgi:DNA-binding NarL/FixJ family response regulator
MSRIAIISSELTPVAGLRSELRKQGSLDLMPPFGSIDMFLANVAGGTPDIILLELPSCGLLTALHQLRLKAPHADIVLLVDFASPELAIRAVQAGVRGILRKALPADLQVKCLLKVKAGELWIEKARAVPAPKVAVPDMTGAQSDLLRAVAQGLKDSEIAAALGITVGAVKLQLTSLFRQLGVKDRFELALFGLTGGIGEFCGFKYLIPALHHGAPSDPQYTDGAGDGIPVPVPTLH